MSDTFHVPAITFEALPAQPGPERFQTVDEAYHWAIAQPSHANDAFQISFDSDTQDYSVTFLQGSFAPLSEA